ncbi:MAG TPA: hypothetical protein VMH36_12910, partial [Alphaproteobacteria bacterium]|nr:hypothetical protein [Alphaproteobacteria bacterium]
LRDDGSIDLELACQQLNLTLDVVQQAAQAAPPIVDKPAEAEDLPASDAQRRLLEAKAESAEHDAAKRRRERLSENGQWLRAEEARIAWQRALAELLNQVEAEFPNMADALLAVPAGR